MLTAQPIARHPRQVNRAGEGVQHGGRRLKCRRGRAGGQIGELADQHVLGIPLAPAPSGNGGSGAWAARCQLDVPAQVVQLDIRGRQTTIVVEARFADGTHLAEAAISRNRPRSPATPAARCGRTRRGSTPGHPGELDTRSTRPGPSRVGGAVDTRRACRCPGHRPNHRKCVGLEVAVGVDKTHHEMLAAAPGPIRLAAHLAFLVHDGGMRSLGAVERTLSVALVRPGRTCSDRRRGTPDRTLRGCATACASQRRHRATVSRRVPPPPQARSWS